jgi:hypothetical protein
MLGDKANILFVINALHYLPSKTIIGVLTPINEHFESQLDDDDEDTIFGSMAEICPTSNDSFKHSGPFV